MLRIGSVTLESAVLLAPMAGITDAPFRAQVRRFGAGLVASEMVASRELLADNASVARKAALTDADGVAAVQIAAREPDAAADAARRAEAGGAAIVDVNFGCPAKKVARSACGAALMREPALAEAIVAAMVRAVSVPVTAKMRLGWDDAARSAPELALRLEGVGAAAIAVHGRTRAQFYSGSADWTAVGDVVRAVSVPVIVNGDVVSTATARAALEASGAAGVMVGRAARGAPWRLAEIAAGLDGRAFAAPSPAERVRLAAAYYRAALEVYGPETGARAARKHLAWRLAEVSGAEQLAKEIVRVAEPVEVAARLDALADRLGSELYEAAA